MCTIRTNLVSTGSSTGALHISYHNTHISRLQTPVRSFSGGKLTASHEYCNPNDSMCDIANCDDGRQVS